MSSVVKPDRGALLPKARDLKVFIFDVDGVLTDGGLYYGPSGEVMKRFDVKDGHAIVLARILGYPAAILTARRSEIVEVRARELGMVSVIQGARDKIDGFARLLADLKEKGHDVTAAQCAYMGDDVNDIGVLEQVGISACPADAVPEVREVCSFVSTRPGGGGAVRELVEWVLGSTGNWQRATALARHPASH